MKLISRWLDLKMLSINTPPPLVASSSYGGSTSYYAFDGLFNNYTYLKNASSTNGWLKIDLGKGEIINKCKITFKSDDMPESFIIEGSNDNIIFEVLYSINKSVNTVSEFSFENNTSYRYYKLNVSGADWVGVYEWQLGQEFIEYDSGLLVKSNNKIYSINSKENTHEINMTSNTNPAPYTASASSQNNVTTYGAWRVFNGVFNNGASIWTTTNNDTTGWVQLDFGVPTNVNSMELFSKNTTTLGGTPKDFLILGSNNGADFTELGRFENQIGWTLNESRVFDFNNKIPYRYYRLKVESIESGNSISIAQIIFSYNLKEVNQIAIASVDNFINYGSEDIIFSGLFTDKNYILQVDTSQDLDGLWVQELNRKPLSIKFE